MRREGREERLTAKKPAAHSEKLPDSSFWVGIRPLVDTPIEAEDMVKIIPPSSFMGFRHTNSCGITVRLKRKASCQTLIIWHHHGEALVSATRRAA